MRHHNSPELAKPNGYTHAVEASGGRTVYVSGQVSLDAAGKLVGAGDFEAQARRVFENLKAALAAAGASLAHVVKITVFVTDLSGLASFRKLRNEYFPTNPPASSLVQVAGLVLPELLIEIEAVAVL
ncbi:MAG TPA: RidA family protein [Myxococcota bacterium]|nr:RidA family protein [Myxococcota bacterium]